MVITKKEKIIFVILAALAIVLVWLYLADWSGNRPTDFGVTYSGGYAESLGLNSQEVFTSILDDLKVKNISLKYLRVLSYPFHPEIKEFMQNCDKVIVVEQNRDSQLASMLKIYFADLAPKIVPMGYSDGLPIDPDIITHKIQEVLHG